MKLTTVIVIKVLTIEIDDDSDVEILHHKVIDAITMIDNLINDTHSILPPPPASPSPSQPSSPQPSSTILLSQTTTSTINYNNDEDLNICKICFERKCNIICIPCGHFMFCNVFIERIMLDIFPQCPVCRKYISREQRVYQ
jgi:hypothetical protein